MLNRHESAEIEQKLSNQPAKKENFQWLAGLITETVMCTIF